MVRATPKTVYVHADAHSVSTDTAPHRVTDPQSGRCGGPIWPASPRTSELKHWGSGATKPKTTTRLEQLVPVPGAWSSRPRRLDAAPQAAFHKVIRSANSSISS